MTHIYRIVCNRASGIKQVVSKYARTTGRSRAVTVSKGKKRCALWGTSAALISVSLGSSTMLRAESIIAILPQSSTFYSRLLQEQKTLDSSSDEGYKKEKITFVYGGGAIESNAHFSLCHALASVGIENSINCHGFYKDKKSSNLEFVSHDGALPSRDSRANVISNSRSGNQNIKNEMVPYVQDLSLKKATPRNEELGIRPFEIERKSSFFTTSKKVNPIVESRSSELSYGLPTTTPVGKAFVNDGRIELLTSMLKRRAQASLLGNGLFGGESTPLEVSLSEGRTERTLISDEHLSLVASENVISNTPRQIIDKANPTEIKLFETKSDTREEPFVGARDECMGLMPSINPIEPTGGLKRSMSSPARLGSLYNISSISKNNNEETQFENSYEMEFGMEKTQNLLALNVTKEFFEHEDFSDGGLSPISAQYYSAPNTIDEYFNSERFSNVEIREQSVQVFSFINVIDNYLGNKNLNDLEIFAGAFAQEEQGNLNTEKTASVYFVDFSDIDTFDTANEWDMLENISDMEAVKSKSGSTQWEKVADPEVRASMTIYSDVFRSDDGQRSVSSDESWSKVGDSRLEDDEVASESSFNLLSLEGSDKAWNNTEPEVVDDHDVGLILAAKNHMVSESDDVQRSVSRDESRSEVDTSRLEKNEVASVFPSLLDSWEDGDETWNDTEPKVVDGHDVGLILAAKNHMVSESDDVQRSVSSDESWSVAGTSRLEENEVASVFPSLLDSWEDGDETWNDTEPKVVDDHDAGLIFAVQNHLVFNGDNDTIHIKGEQPAKVLEFLGNNVTLTTTGRGEERLSLDAPRVEFLVQADSATVLAPITGAGALVKTGQGALLLNGDNTYEGGTRIQAGTIQIDHAQALGADGGALTMAGGTLETRQKMDLGQAVDLQNLGKFKVTGDRLSLNGLVSGAGGLYKTGPGVMVLGNNANTYDGGTWVQDGVVQGTTASIRGDIGIAAGARVEMVTHGLIDTYAGDIRGFNGTTGEAVKRGGGDLKLSGRSEVNWQIDQGGLISSASRFSGNVMLNGNTTRFELKDDTASVYAGTILGTGEFIKSGSAKLLLTGDSSTFAGKTIVKEGTLSVGNASGGKLGGDVEVEGNAVLGGSGMITGSLILKAGAILSPGNSIGTIRIGGDYRPSATNTLDIETNPANADTDQVIVGGTAYLAGSVKHIGDPGTYRALQSYTILTAGNIVGTFSGVSSTFTFLDPVLDYSVPNSVVLALKRNGVSFNQYTHTANQRAVAKTLDRLPQSGVLYEAVVSLPGANVAQSMNALSGELHASMKAALQSSARTASTLPLNYLRTNLLMDQGRESAQTQLAGVGGVPSLSRSAVRPLWAELVGNWQSLSGNDNYAQTKQTTTGLFFGGDAAVGNDWRVGGAFGYTDGTIRINGRDSRAEVDTYSATMYAGRAIDAGDGRKLNVMVGSAYSWHDIDSRRQIAAGDALNDTAKASYKASTAQVFGEVGYAITVGLHSTLEPFAGVGYSDLRTRGFKESGSVAALSGQSQNAQTTSTMLGLRGATTLELGQTSTALRATLGWLHAMGDTKVKSVLAFESGPAFTVAGSPIARDAAVVELGAEVAISRNARLGISYSGQFSRGNTENAGSMTMRWRF